MIRYQPTEAIALPLSIRPPQQDGIWRELVPGVRLQPYEGQLRDVIASLDKTHPPHAHTVPGPSHLLVIQPVAYLDGVRKRLSAEGTKIPKSAVEFVGPNTLARQCLVSAVLASKNSFAVASSYSVRRRGRAWHARGFANSPLEQVSGHVQAALHSGPLDLEATKAIAPRLDRYYRAISWWTDRVGMALGYLWEGLCAQYPGQTYITLISLIDCLVGTRQSGGHALAERVAVLLSPDSAVRQAEYSVMVELYKTRNRLVHASVHPRKGRQTNQSLFMGAKYSTVPQEDLAALISVCVRLLRTCLNDVPYLTIVQARGSESKVDEKLDSLFLDRLFGAA